MIRLENILTISWQNVLKISWRRFCKKSSRCLEDVLKMFFQDVFYMFWKRLEDVLKTSGQDECVCLEQDVLKTSSEDVWLRLIYSSWQKNVLKTSLWRFLKTKTKDIFRTFSRCLHQDECLPGERFKNSWFNVTKMVDNEDRSKLMFILFINPWILYEGVFSLWVSLNRNKLLNTPSHSSIKLANPSLPVIPSYLIEIIQTAEILPSVRSLVVTCHWETELHAND